jgi:hypothetical protein
VTEVPQALPQGYADLLSDIKQRVRHAQTRAVLAVNAELIQLYWDIGGHDEDFAGIYGKDYLFRRRALAHAPEVALSDHPLARVGTMTITDAGTTTVSRANTPAQTLRGYLLQALKALRLMRGVQTLTNPYHRVV